MKRCSRCGETKPLSEYQFRSDSHGLRGTCRDCVRRNHARYREANREIKRERDRDYERNRRGNRRDGVDRTAEKDRAHKAVERAVLRGNLVKPNACSRCGAIGVVEGHHDDYARPLDVRWLCRSCHRLHHMEERRRTDNREAADEREARATLYRRTPSSDVSPPVLLGGGGPSHQKEN